MQTYTLTNIHTAYLIRGVTVVRNQLLPVQPLSVRVDSVVEDGVVFGLRHRQIKRALQ